MLINNHEIIIERKNVKHINLKVYPNLTIKASVPYNIDIKYVKKMIELKEEWLNNQLYKYKEQYRLTKRYYISGEDHYFNGKRFILKVINSNKPSVMIENGKIIKMYIRKSSSLKNKDKLMQLFYKEQLRKKLNKFIPELENLIGVNCSSFFIRKLKNKWSICNTKDKILIFNVDLAKKKDSEIKYVIIHELIHLKEKYYNDNFKKLLNIYCPKWEQYRDSLREILYEY